MSGLKHIFSQQYSCGQQPDQGMTFCLDDKGTRPLLTWIPDCDIFTINDVNTKSHQQRFYLKLTKPERVTLLPFQSNLQNILIISYRCIYRRYTAICTFVVVALNSLWS